MHLFCLFGEVAVNGYAVFLPLGRVGMVVNGPAMEEAKWHPTNQD